ncbi:N-acetylmuramoyl-L-alanine amidase [Mucilaginibacter sp. RS28]|uniref:N-acetylmuramoyl-L-alanine amidase n=1 Tax=Mucilaginibacter straminoryzae TaxID=2932774 RepID=A0A9X2B8Y6_9SPHI|nr:N-acetylmuramoyl-L-alanine amidase [Mucilaginibacter straminoryzae]MCJ8209160.1 N-acetylmuramoyl-L-alanine amidase [Mucilaginibacter straminoryzae]
MTESKKRLYPLTFILLFLGVLLSAFKPRTDTTQYRFNTIVIDAGHGGKDPGAHGAFSVEKNVALSIALKLEKAINDQMPEMRTIMTRKTDVFIPLNERAHIANSNRGQLYISIHCNSSPYAHGKDKGVLLLVYGFHRSGEQREAIRENASIFIEKDYKTKYSDYDPTSPAAAIILNNYMLKYRKQSILFGTLVNDELKENDNRHSLGVKEQGVLVLAHSAMPAVLVETGFINNVDEEGYLNSAEGQNAIVQSIVRALKEYRGRLNGN